MKHSTVLILTTVILYSACSEDPKLEPLNDGLAPSAGAASDTVAVDGLIVGHRLMAAGEYELALREFYRAAVVHGLNAEVLSSIGSANLRLGRLGQAERMLRRAVEEDETFAAAWNNLGVTLMERGDAGEAARVFRIAFSLDRGESAEIKENLERALSQLKNPAYTTENTYEYELVRPDVGTYRLQSVP